jgi:hypothetical protein
MPGVKFTLHLFLNYEKNTIVFNGGVFPLFL